MNNVCCRNPTVPRAINVIANSPHLFTYNLSVVTYTLRSSVIKDALNKSLLCKHQKPQKHKNEFYLGFCLTI